MWGGRGVRITLRGVTSGPQDPSVSEWGGRGVRITLRGVRITLRGVTSGPQDPSVSGLECREGGGQDYTEGGH